MKDKIFIHKWLISIIIGFFSIIIGAIGFIVSYLEMGILFSLFGVTILFLFIVFVPHTFIFDNEKIAVIGVFINKTIKYVHIKCCDKKESGI